MTGDRRGAAPGVVDPPGPKRTTAESLVPGVVYDALPMRTVPPKRKEKAVKLLAARDWLMREPLPSASLLTGVGM